MVCPAGKHQLNAGQPYCNTNPAGKSIQSQAVQRTNATISGVDFATFDQTMQDNFRRKIAVQLGVPVALVALANVAANHPAGRRLTASSPGVAFTIIITAAPGSEAIERFEALVLHPGNITAALQGAYLEAGTLQPAEMLTEVTSTIAVVEMNEVECSPGKYFSPGTNSSKCLFCQTGTYQGIPGSEFCLTCPSRATTSGRAVSAMDCVCEAGYFMVVNGTWERGIWYPVERPECRVCPKGADCSVAGARTATITTLPNFWRASTSTSYFDTLSCAPDTCVGGTFSVSVSTGSQCAAGQSGLMCSVCDTSKRYARHLGAKCIKCSGTATEELLKIVGGICALIIGSLMVFIIIIKPLLRRLRKRMTLSQLRKAIYKRQMKIKILLSFVQGN
jgi:hypothetical protein